nr:MAG: hypothetical protein [Armillaria species ambi-like virus 8]
MGRLGYSTQEHRNMLQFIGPSSTDVVKSTLEQTPLVDVMVPYGVANLRGFMAWSVTVKLVTSFLRIHWEAVRSGFQMTTSIAIRPDAPNKKVFPSYRTTDSNDKASKFEKDDEAYKALSGASVDNTLIAMARCQDGAVSGYGPGDALPEFEHNMVFTYFDGMQLPDKFMPLTIISTMFFYALGTNFENCTNTMTMLRKGWSSLSTTVHGKAISHLLQGCQLGFETGAAVYAVIEARAYQGFVLVSHQPFWIGIRGKQVTSYAYSQAKIDLQLASSHVKALSQICKVVSGCFLRGQTAKEIIKRSDIQTARGLYIEVMKRQLSKDEKEEITRWADYLSFPQEYMKVTPANLAALFSAYSGKTEFTVGIPMFLGAGCIVSESRAVQLCAAFGVTAPSLMMPKGDTCKVPVPGSGIDASIVADKDGRAFMPFIALYMKSVKAAAADLDKVFKSAEVSFRRGVKGGASKTQYQFIGANKDDIWRELSDCIAYKHSIDNASKKKVDDKGKGKKRQADDDGGAPAKKARDEEDFSSFL